MPGGAFGATPAEPACWAPSRVDPYSCIRTLTRSIGCVTAPDAIAPRDPDKKPFQGACFLEAGGADIAFDDGGEGPDALTRLGAGRRNTCCAAVIHKSKTYGDRG